MKDWKGTLGRKVLHRMLFYNVRVIRDVCERDVQCNSAHRVSDADEVAFAEVDIYAFAQAGEEDVYGTGVLLPVDWTMESAISPWARRDRPNRQM